MRRREDRGRSIPLDQVPDWVLSCRPRDWLAQLTPSDFTGLATWGPSTDLRVQELAVMPVWRDARNAWIAEHAPAMTYRERRDEYRRRYPVVDGPLRTATPRAED